ncbi:Mpo1-like protein [Microbulbifer sp. MCCC 1A16149]|uniref:Mpo1-like protein n=1 Tax=Microbulbifer sp. MCCC 1A16149 TaxID=3411322 RepID=UPI003D112FEB
MNNPETESSIQSGDTPKFDSFKAFYPFYLNEHSNLTCRRLHFVGTALVIGLLIAALVTQRWGLLAVLPVAGYGFAWVGHFFFEHNRPATFKNPFYSLWGDFVMFKDMLLGRIER